MYTDINYEEIATDFLKQLKEGAFLTVKSGDKINTMTISWGTIGFLFERPVLSIYVRYSRETYHLLEESNAFTVSVPINSNMKEELALAGVKSGKDFDKFQKLSITPIPGRKLDVPIIEECDLHFECKVIYQQSMEPRLLDPKVRKQFYDENSDYHVIYYGEIVDSYINGEYDNKYAL